MFTDVDVPVVSGVSPFVEWDSGIQDILNKIDNVAVDIMQAHGVPG